ncbi:hypothetical protein BSR56_14015 [Acinetobacter haemolyticus]|nr:hypothetical protein BSR56_14015 [Acinetobacter haemolyticus]
MPVGIETRKNSKSAPNAHRDQDKYVALSSRGHVQSINRWLSNASSLQVALTTSLIERHASRDTHI